MLMITISYAVIALLEWQILKRKKNGRQQRTVYFILVGALFLFSITTHIFKADFQIAALILHGFGPLEKWITGG